MRPKLLNFNDTRGSSLAFRSRRCPSAREGAGRCAPGAGGASEVRGGARSGPARPSCGEWARYRASAGGGDGAVGEPTVQVVAVAGAQLLPRLGLSGGRA